MTQEGFPLSPLQTSHWHFREAFAETPWASSLVVRVEGGLSEPDLRTAFERLGGEHEILRTAFRPIAGIPAQMVEDSARFDLEEVDLGNENLHDLRKRLEGPFDLAGGATLRVALARDGEQTFLVLAQPYLAGDAHALWNLTRELGRELAGDAASDAPMQFADLAQWQLDTLSGEQAPQGIASWKAGGFEGPAPTLPLEYDRGSEGFHPAEHGLELEDEDWMALDQTAERLASDRGTLVLAIYKLLLARHTAPSRPVVAITTAGRTYEGLDEALGCFARALPVAIRVNEADSLGALVRATAAERFAAEDAYEYFDPYTLGLPEDWSTPYHFEHVPAVEPFEAGGRHFTAEGRRQLGEPFHLRLSLHAGNKDRLFFSYDPRFLAAADVEVIADQFRTLMRAGVADSSSPMSGLTHLSSETREDLVEGFGSGAALEAELTLVLDEFLERANEAPDSVAVASAQETLTYGQLEARSRALASRLLEAGVSPGDFVGLYLGRSADTVVALLGTLRAGAAYLPLPPDYPADRLRTMLEDTEATVVVTSDADHAPEGFQGTRITLTDLEEDGAALNVNISGDLPAYVIFTSGSTGRPKGVPVSHANLAFSTSARRQFYASPVEAYLLLSSFAFDSSVAGLFWTLAEGGKLVLPSDGFEEDLPALVELIREQEVTHLLGLPSLWSVLLESGNAADLGSLTDVIVAGESCPPELPQRHADTLESTRLFNEYGPTEATVWSSVHDCATLPERPQVPIGRPIPGAQLLVVTPRRELAAPGLAGEIWIGGPGVTAGYLGRPELTAERFVEGPSGIAGRFYRTGDRGRFLPGGELEFLGRLDGQVKIRGYRIELEEIEARLSDLEGVREAAVLAQEERPGELRLVAHVAPATASEETLRAGLAVSLPAYMQPARFVFHARFPKLPNGKIDRHALEEAEPAETEAAPFEAPEGALEKVLAAIWQDLLGAARVGRSDDFFALGGHSILATQLFARLIDTLQVKIPLRALFENRTLEALARVLRDQEGDRLERTAEIVLQVIELSDDEADAALGA